MKTKSLFTFAVCGALVVQAGTFSIKPECGGKTVSLTDGGIYVEGAAPSAGDTLAITNAYPYTSVTVADEDSLELLSSLGYVDLGYGCRLVLECAGDLTLPMPVKGNGTLVKSGNGTLQLASHTTSGNIYYDYNVHVDVQKGTLRLPMADDAKACTHAYFNMNVAAGATLVTVSNGTTQVSTLTGSGTITNEQAAGLYAQLNVTKSDSSFDGLITGPITVRPISGGSITLSNGENGFTGGIQMGGYATYGSSGGGVLQVTKISNSTGRSSLGTGSATAVATSTGGGLVRYIGSEDCSIDRTFYLPSSPLVLDGGHHGGISFTGLFATYGSTAALSELQLTGSNAVPCDIYGELRSYLLDGFYRPFYILKRGTGTWRIFDRFKSGHATKVNAANAPRGVIAVEEGTLGFDSLANAGTYCALGFATDLYRRGTVLPSDDGVKVDYAWLLGGTDASGAATEGRMLYSGADVVQVTNRPLAIATAGAFATSQGRVRLFDARPEGTGAKTLALEAPAGITNDFCDIAGTAGSPIGLVKRGAGTWRIGGSVSLGGPIAVEGGELVVENRPQGSPCKWFRLTVKETAATCARYGAGYVRPDGVATNFNSTDKYVTISEMGLYDANGNRLGLGTVESGDALDIQPGQSHIGDGCSNAVTFNPLDANSTACSTT